MERLIIPATTSSPEVVFDPEREMFSIRGESYPADTAAFYLPILKWLNAYFSKTGQHLPFLLTLDIAYCNSSSTKVLMDLLFLLEQTAEQGRAVTLRWLYDEENDTAYETGEELQEDVEFLHFELIGNTVASL